MITSDLSISQKQKEVVEEFAFFEDWTDKYEHIISLGKSLPILDAQHKTNNNLIKGCQSQVWLNANFKNANLINANL